jgi:hypothetical protein
VGAQYDEESTSPVEFLAICVSYNFTDKFGSFVENYDYFAAGLKPVTSIDFGSTYMVTSNVQLDMSANLNLNDFRHYFMISGGVAWRMVKKPKTKTKI